MLMLKIEKKFILKANTSSVILFVLGTRAAKKILNSL